MSTPAPRERDIQTDSRGRIIRYSQCDRCRTFIRATNMDRHMSCCISSSQKRCKKCRRIHPKTFFTPASNTADHRDIYCRRCRRRIARDWYNSHKEAEVLRSITWNRKNYSRFLENHRRYYRKNSARLNRIIRAKRVENPEVFREYGRRRRFSPSFKSVTARWRKNNPDRLKFYASNKQDRRRARQGGWSEIRFSDWVAIKKAFKHRCIYCGKRKRLSMDHFIPLAKGGRHNKRNIVPACFTCNFRKGSMMPEAFMARLMAEAI